MNLEEFNAQYNHPCSEEEQYVAPSDPEVLKSLQTFQDEKFGLMMHWGHYSQWGIIESWPLVDADQSWAWKEIDRDTPMSEFKQQYWDLIKTFNPVRFCPEEWAQLAVDGGFRYVLLTTKHHDGFCMWDTNYSAYKITSPDCPFHHHKHADVCRALFDACREKGLNVHAYFSKPDWHSEYYWAKGFVKDEYMTRNPSYDTKEHPELWEKFCAFTRNQILELIREYGRIECLWLDGGQVCPQNHQDIHLSEIVKEARKIQPWLMVADRTVGGENENFITPEQTVPDRAISVPWESCITLGTSFSYRFDDEYKSAKTVIHMLCDIVAKGGNLVLNIGPRPDGKLPQNTIPIIREVGEWLQENGYAIYGTRPAAPYRDQNIAYTSKQDEIYAIYLPQDQHNTLPNHLVFTVFVPVSSVLFRGESLPFTCDGTNLTVHVPDNVPTSNAYVFTIKTTPLS